MQHRITIPHFWNSGRLRPVVRYMIAITTLLVGISDMLSAIVPKLSSIVSNDWNIFFVSWPLASHRVPAQSFTVVIGFFLIVLSYGLMRGKKHAHRIALILLMISAVLHVQRSGSVLATFVALLLATLLLGFRHFFQAKSDPPCARRGYITLCLGLSIVIFYLIGGSILLYNEFEPLIDHMGVENFLIHLLYNQRLYLPHGTRAFFLQRTFPVLCISAVLYSMIQIFHPVAAVLMPETEERERVHWLVRHYGKNSISYFALGEDKTYFFSQSGKSVISYVLQGSTAVVAGDPIGPTEELSIVLKQFIDFCKEQDWTIVFWQVCEDVAEMYHAAKFRLLKIGEDAVLNPQTFTLKGGAMANVRSSAKRAEKDSLSVLFYRGQVTNTEQLLQMEQISIHWLAQKGGSEMGFSMGSFEAQGNSEYLYALAVDAQNKVHGFVSFIPIYGRRGWGLDLMRRAETCAPGTMELLLARSIEYMKDQDATMVSLGLAPLSNANEEDETFLTNSIDFLTRRFGNLNQRQSLFNFKKKFQPTWESRYLVYSDALNLPKIGWALYHAHQKDASVLKTLGYTIKDRLNHQKTNKELVRNVETAKA